MINHTMGATFLYLMSRVCASDSAERGVVMTGGSGPEPSKWPRATLRENVQVLGGG